MRALLTALCCPALCCPALVCLALSCAPGPAAAQQTLPADAPDDEWRLDVTPYLFLPVTTTGTTSLAGRTVDVDLDMGDVLEALNLAFSARIEARRGPFGVILDLYYVELGGGASAQFDGGASARVDVTFRQAWAALLGGYRFFEGSFAGPDGKTRRYALDAAAGVRWNLIDQEVRAKVAGGAGNTIGGTVSGQENFFEPTFMLRGAVALDERWTLGARADLGGFGVSGNDLQWLLLAGAEYRAWDSTTLRAGWQFYGIDYATNRANGRFAYDVFQTGPYLGMTLRF